MRLITQIKQPIKMLRWQLRRMRAARRWGAERLARAPIVIGNAMPKSGSHLLIQILLGLSKIGPFVDPGLPPLTRSAANRNLSEDQVIATLHRLKPGDIAYCYLHARQPYIDELTRLGVAAFFLYRDPRDLIVSHVFYATKIHHKHGMHKYYTKALSTMEQRITAAIQGVRTAGANLSPIAAKYQKYLGWLDQPGVLPLRFEDLILDREKSLIRILDHIAARGFQLQLPRDKAVAFLAQGVTPHTSGTFRRGKPGEWREHFTEENKRQFKASTGDLLIRLGYETSTAW
jgi:hypothetical protein